MDILKIHLIKGEENQYALFYYPTFTLFRINRNSYQVLHSIQKGENISDIAKSQNLDIVEIERFVTHLKECCPDQMPSQDIEIVGKRRSLSRITLHVANDCNLRCHYCYANGGNYNLDRNLMNSQKALDFVDFCCQNFDAINTIVFFGGEPLLNLPIIELVCREFLLRKERKQINFVPEFGIITNGTVLNEEVLRIVRSYISFITVSIDGPQNVNDVNRQYANGKGCYQQIANFISVMQEKTNVSLCYEATYTQEHIKLGVTQEDVRHFLKNTFGLEGTIVHEWTCPKEDVDYRFFLNNLEKTDDKLDYSSDLMFVLGALVNKQDREMCPIVRKMIAISTDGDIYPCHMKIGKKHLSLGNISGMNAYSNSSIPMPDYIRGVMKDNPVCRTCWAQRICGGCATYWFFNEEQDAYQTVPNPYHCVSNLQYIENALLAIANFQADKEKWEQFKKNMLS